MENKDFCVFILTHGRPNNVKTLATLNKSGYTGLIYFIVDNEDKFINSYISKFGKEWVKIFDKKAMADEIDECDNFDERRTTTHARNACFKIAKDLGITYFIQLDDDYTSFRYRWVDNKYYTSGVVKNLDKFFDIYLNFYKSTNCLSIAFAQGGDFIGGESCGMISNYKQNCRKAMNSFICSTNRPFKFIGSMNEDVNAYIHLGAIGHIFLTLPYIGLEQAPTQIQKGAISDKYKLFGTYCKSFMTVMINPSCVKVSMMGFTEKRLHHRVKWINATPMILDPKHKK